MKTPQPLAALIFLLVLCSVYGCTKKREQTVRVQFINACVHTPYLEYYLQGSKRAEYMGYGICSNSNTANLEAGESLKIEIKDPVANTVVASGNYANWKPNWH